MSSRVNLFFYCFYVFLGILLFCALFRSVVGMEPLTFSSLLQSFSSMPNVTVSVFNDLTIYGDWGIFNGFKDFLNIFTGLFSVLVYLVTMLVQVVMVIIWALRWFLGF